MEVTVKPESLRGLRVAVDKGAILACSEVQEHIATQTEKLTEQLEGMRREELKAYEERHSIRGPVEVSECQPGDPDGYVMTLKVRGDFVKRLMATGQSPAGESRMAIEQLVEFVGTALAKQGISGGPSFEKSPHHEPAVPAGYVPRAY
jgi:hypothetical protein